MFKIESRTLQDSRGKLKNTSRFKRKVDFKNQESRFKDQASKNQDQDSRLKIQESREDLIKISMKRDQRKLGNKGDKGWKRSAFAAAMLSTSFNVNVTSDNVKNRIKLWRSWYGIVSDILGQSEFDWDGTKHMIIVENENAWNEYCTSHKSAKPFRFKVLQNWDDIVGLCAKDRATGHGAETAMDADEAMSRETNEVEFMGLGATAIDLEEPSSNIKGKRQGSISSGTHPHKRKMGVKEGITASLDKMANSFNRMVEKMDGKVDDEDIQEVLREAALIPDINRQQ
ncbi:hypothetical protein HKD37_03G007335 [Glycine soja]